MKQKDYAESLMGTSTPWLKVPRGSDRSVGDPLDIALGRRPAPNVVPVGTGGTGAPVGKGKAPLRPGVDLNRATRMLPKIPADGACHGTGGAVALSRAAATAKPLITIMPSAQPSRIVTTSLQEIQARVPQTPPRDLTEHQRLELMMPGYIWYVQCKELLRLGEAPAEWCHQLAYLFAETVMEVLDDLPNDDAGWKCKLGLIDRLAQVSGRVYGPTDGENVHAVFLASELWLSSLLTTGILELHEGSRFAKAIQEFNEAIMEVEENRVGLEKAQGDALRIAAAIQGRFNREGFFQP